CARWLPLMDYW
nr:immunoglobulin heavy chain junction region [Mus musculus]